MFLKNCRTPITPEVLAVVHFEKLSQYGDDMVSEIVLCSDTE